MYQAEPENRAMGQAFGKKFDKTFKKAISELPSDAIRSYLKDGKLAVNGNEIVSGMLTISKHFKPEFNNSS